MRRCWGVARNLRRCGRYGEWRLFCSDHHHQPILAAWVLLFTVIAGVASIYSAWFGARPHQAQPEAQRFDEKEASELRNSMPTGTRSAVDLNLPSSLHVRLGSVLPHQFDFAVVSTGQNQFVVKHLYLLLRGYAECALRNEMSILGAVSISTRYSVQLSPEYARYDLPSLGSLGDAGVWTYSQSSDQFGVEVLYPNYVFFVVSIEAEGEDLTIGKPFHISSDVMNFIDVANGNYGGCLDLESWYQPAMLRRPAARAYLESVSLIAHQLLTIDVSQANSILFKAPRAQLVSALPELEKISKARPANEVFAKNVREVRSVLSRRKE